MAISFVGPGKPLSQDGIDSSSKLLAVAAPEVWTVLQVETSGCGYLGDRRPAILFERHYFSRLTNHAYDASHPGISNPSAGGYGAGGAHQYDRLNEALALDEQAALKSASWGIGQVMGDNFAVAGFQNVTAMVTALVAAEDSQLSSVAHFIKGNGLASALAKHDWAAFAKGYNGPSYAKNNYDKNLAQAYSKLSAGPLPNLTVRSAQVYLMYLGYDPGPIDGMAGSKTYTALHNFQKAKGLAVTNTIDQGTVDALAKALGL